MTSLMPSNLDKIGEFLQDSQYRSLMMNSANYNVRIAKERKSRLPFLDSQTGQCHSPVRPLLSAHNRLPPSSSCLLGQVYRYPAQCWRRKNRSYIQRQHHAAQEAVTSEHAIVTIENPATEAPEAVLENIAIKEGYYYDDGVGFLEDSMDELDNEDDNDDDDTYGVKSGGGKRRKTMKTAKKSSTRGVGRGRRKETFSAQIKASPVEGIEDALSKRYDCQKCNAKYKTRQGLSYHMSHTHKNEDNSTASLSVSVAHSPSFGNSAPSSPIPKLLPTTLSLHSNQPSPLSEGLEGDKPLSVSPHVEPPPPYEVCEKITESRSASPQNRIDSLPTVYEENQGRNSREEKSEVSFMATPNPYCDFCLGDSRYNKKTGAPESMVSCADCGRSGHPSCLQFTRKMMENVAKYRWQCIECKCCTLCGTAENDDQLLFCDDCDRGYHLYCVKPPLSAPPEGEWACHLCVDPTGN